MKKIYLIYFILMFISFSGNSQSYSIESKEINKLEVSVYDASIKVIGTEEDVTTISLLNQNSKKALNTKKSPHYDVRVENGVIRIFKKKNKRVKNALIEVSIPKHLTCEINTYFGKEIMIENLQGNVIAKNHFGEIKLTNVRGLIEANSFSGNIRLVGIVQSTIAHSSKGDVTASFERIAPRFDSSISSLEGNITISLPGTSNLLTATNTFSGRVDSQFEMKIPTKTNHDREPEFSYRAINEGSTSALLIVKNHFGNISFMKH